MTTDYRQRTTDFVHNVYQRKVYPRTVDCCPLSVDLKNNKMKKLIISIIFALGFGMSLNAQSDGFFAYNNMDEKRNGTMGELPALPSAHGLNGNSNAPLGSGVLILTALALLKLKNED